MKLLDFFNYETHCCNNCMDSNEITTEKCRWEDKYPEEMVFALAQKWIIRRDLCQGVYCYNTTHAGGQFHQQLRGNFG